MPQGQFNSDVEVDDLAGAIMQFLARQLESEGANVGTAFYRGVTDATNTQSWGNVHIADSTFEVRVTLLEEFGYYTK